MDLSHSWENRVERSEPALLGRAHLAEWAPLELPSPTREHLTRER